LFLSKELILYPKCARPRYCINLPDSIESNKNYLREYVFTNPFDWIREGQKSTSKKLEDIYESHHGVVQARCLLDYQMFSLQVANKPVMHDIKRHIKL